MLELIVALLALLGYDHPRFDMGPAHHKLRCGACHVAAAPPSPACEGCHAQRSHHGTRFAKLACADCHSSSSQRWAPVASRFDHDHKTRFRRDWFHREIACRECHRGSSPADFEDLSATLGTCTGCHAHADVHDHRYGDRQCLNCHLMPGSSQF